MTPKASPNAYMCAQMSSPRYMSCRLRLHTYVELAILRGGTHRQAAKVQRIFDFASEFVFCGHKIPRMHPEHAQNVQKCRL